MQSDEANLGDDVSKKMVFKMGGLREVAAQTDRVSYVFSHPAGRTTYISGKVMKPVLFTILLFSVGSARAATLLGMNLATPVSRLPNCDTSAPPCLHAVAPDVYTLQTHNRPAWARGVITITTVKGRIAQVFIESQTPVHIPVDGPLSDRVRIHEPNRWVYWDGATATYVATIPGTKTSDISIAVIPAPATVTAPPESPAQ